MVVEEVNEIGDYILRWRKYGHSKFNNEIWYITKEMMSKYTKMPDCENEKGSKIYRT